MQQKVLITGANSLLGTHVIHELLAAGYAVRGLLRRRNSYVGNNHPALELIEGSCTDRNTLRQAMQGCRYVIHCAARTGQSGDYNSYKKINVTATTRLIETAIECGIKRVVYVASANVFAYGTKEQPGDEKHPIAFPFTESPYAKSKYEALQQLENYHGQIEIVTVCPTFMIGAWNSRPSSGRIILRGYRRRIVFYPPGGKNFVAAGDVARGIVTALTEGHNGEQYLLAGENLTYAEFYRLLATRTHCRQRLVQIPAWLLLAIGTIGDWLSKTGLKSEITRANMRILCVGNYYSNAKSVRELHLCYRPLAEAIDEAVNWFLQYGMLPKNRHPKPHTD